MQAATTIEIHEGSPPAGRRRILFDTRAAAAYFGVPCYWLEHWRQRRCGPSFIRVNRSVLYPLDLLDDFIDKRLEQFHRLPRPMGGRLPGGRNRPRKLPEAAAPLTPIARMKRFAEAELAQKEDEAR